MNGSAVIELVTYVSVLYALLYATGSLLIQADDNDTLPEHKFNSVTICPRCGGASCDGPV